MLFSVDKIIFRFQIDSKIFKNQNLQKLIQIENRGVGVIVIQLLQNKLKIPEIKKWKKKWKNMCKKYLGTTITKMWKHWNVEETINQKSV